MKPLARIPTFSHFYFLLKDKFEKEKINVIDKTVNLIEENKNEKKLGFGPGVSDKNNFPMTGQEKLDAYLVCEKVGNATIIYKIFTIIMWW